MRRDAEGALVKALLELLQIARVPAWRNHTTGIFDPIRARFRSFHGLKGVADILGILPECRTLSGERRAGVFLAVEAKVRPNKLSADQAHFLEMVNAAGGIGVCCYSLEDLQEVLRDLGRD